ncbi:MAG: metallophosphoesterase [Microvirga sp.]
MRVLSRRAFLATAAGLGGLGLGGYAFAVEPGLRLRVQRYALTPPGWTPGFALRLVILADLHAGMPSMPMARVRRIIEVANALEPDLILLLGDYSNTDRLLRIRADWSEVVPALMALKAPLGRYAILGNHEWWDDPRAQKERRGPTIAHRIFADTDIPLLENDAARLVKDGRPFWLLGLGDQLAFHIARRRQIGVDDLAGTLAKVTDDAPAILMAHEPDIFPRVPQRVSLTLSGHTHGGQVRMFGWSPVVPSEFGNRYAYGHVVEGGRHLIVSGGLGTVSAGLAPVRLGVPPEIVVVELGGEASADIS